MSASAEALATTHAAAFTDHRPWSTQEFSDLLRDRSIRLIGNEWSFVLARVIAGEAEILTLATHPLHQRKGLAQQCLVQLERDLAGQVEVIFLEVSAENSPARALYDSLGFVQTGLRKGYYRHKGQPPVDALILAKSLG